MFERYRILADSVETELAAELERLETPKILRDAMAHSLLAKAKRLRAVSLLLTLEAYGLSWQQGLFPALALEYIHCYSLIHDDLPCMDDDYLRRGRPTNHLAYGEAVALLAGDALLTEAFSLIGRGLAMGDYDSAIFAAIVRELASAAGASGMIAGQVEDILSTHQAAVQAGENAAADDRLQRLRRMHLLKTGAILRAPFCLAASIAELPDCELELLGSFGAQFGLVFQIQDDLLDYLGDASLMGKATGRDARLCKLTYPALLGIAHTQEILNREQDKLQRMLCDLSCRHDDLQRLLDAIYRRNS